MSELICGNTGRYLSGEPLKHVVRTPDGTLQGFENALFAICFQIPRRSDAAEDRYRRGSRFKQV
jgi:hypothetical protein